MQTFNTRKAAVAYMASKGVPEPLAKAAIDQQFNYDEDGDTRDLLQDIEDSGPVAVTQTELELFNLWENTWEPMLTDDQHGIYVDGELTYDVHGDLLKK